MNQAINWTASRDLQLRRLRAEGARWVEIAAAFSVSQSVVRERGRKLGITRPRTIPCREREDPARPPLPPGDRRSWGMLNQHTCLSGTAWPGWA